MEEILSQLQVVKDRLMAQKDVTNIEAEVILLCDICAKIEQQISSGVVVNPITAEQINSLNEN